MSAAPGQVLQIGEWSVDPALGAIASGDRVTKLDPLTMRLLLYFADNAGRVIALQELLDAVWPNVVVTPQSVYNTVAQLRRTLGDLADAPTYIAEHSAQGLPPDRESRAPPSGTPGGARRDAAGHSDSAERCDKGAQRGSAAAAHESWARRCRRAAVARRSVADVLDCHPSRCADRSARSRVGATGCFRVAQRIDRRGG